MMHRAHSWHFLVLVAAAAPMVLLLWHNLEQGFSLAVVVVNIVAVFDPENDCDSDSKHGANISQQTTDSSWNKQQARPIDLPVRQRNVSLSFQHSLEANIGRGMNIINMYSGCTMARWVYRGNLKIFTKYKHKGGGGGGGKLFNSKSLHDCKRQPQAKKLQSVEHATHSIQTNDTVFVPFILLQEFVNLVLPKLTTDLVIIASQFQTIDTNEEKQVVAAAKRIVESPRVLHYFLTDPGRYANKNIHHRISSFPIGLKPFRYQWRGVKYMHPIPHYQKAFLLNLHTTTTTNKTIPVLATYMRPTSDARRNIQQTRSKPLDYPDYLAEIAKSWYVLSPSGRHPDCHRNYEAVGLGSVPITDLHPTIYTHWRQHGPIIFNNTDWDLNHLEATLPKRPKTNRNMVFEESWMEYVEDTVGRPLHWWDRVAQKPCPLRDFELGTASLVMKNILGFTVPL